MGNPLQYKGDNGSGPFWTGTAIFFVLALLGPIWGRIRYSGGKREMATILPPLCVFCMWLMWACTWLHQWHPLIYPFPNNMGAEE